jgi:hypothetical protein
MIVLCQLNLIRLKRNKKKSKKHKSQSRQIGALLGTMKFAKKMKKKIKHKTDDVKYLSPNANSMYRFWTYITNLIFKTMISKIYYIVTLIIIATIIIFYMNCF